MFDKYIKFYNLFSTNFNEIINNNINLLVTNIKKKHKKLSWIIPYIEFFNDKQNIFLILFIFISFIFSNFFIRAVFFFLLFDSLILSILVLHKKMLELNSRRLAKNVISLFILYINFISSTFTLFIIILLYSEFSKFINKIIFKIIESFICFIHNNVSFVSKLYPNINSIEFNKPIESTEKSYST